MKKDLGLPMYDVLNAVEVIKDALKYFKVI